MKTLIVILLTCLLFTSMIFCQNIEAEKETIKKVIVDSYVNGIFNEGNAEAVKKGWHYDSDIVMLQQGNIIKLPAYYWLDRFEKEPGPLHAGTKHEFSALHVAGDAGMAVVEIYQEDKHIYTDFMSLYKFSDGWKIVSKIFATFK